MEHTETTQTDRSEETTATIGIPGLDKMITNAPYEIAAALFAGIEIALRDKELAKRIQAFVRGYMPEFFEQTWPDKNKAGERLDVECDVMPVVKWLRFIDGFKAANNTKAKQQN